MNKNTNKEKNSIAFRLLMVIISLAAYYFVMYTSPSIGMESMLIDVLGNGVHHLLNGMKFIFLISTIVFAGLFGLQYILDAFKNE